MSNRLIYIAVLLNLLPVLAGAQAPGVAPTSSQSASAHDAPVRIELTKSAIQGDLPLSVKRAIELALERNPTLLVEKIRLEQAREKILEERGFYDPVFNIRSSLGKRDNEIASRFYPTGFYSDNERIHTLGIESKYYTGTRLNFGLDYKRLASSSNTQTLSPQYSANLGVTLIQPLLRDFGWDVNTTRIRIAEKGEGIAEQSLAHRVSQLVQQVEELYWAVLFLQRDLALKRKSLDLARELLRRNEDLVRGGRVAPVSIIEARAGVAVREEGAISAEGELRKFEDRLKVVLQADVGKTNLNLVDLLMRELSSPEAERSLELALKQRADVLALKTELEQREIERNFADNQTMPRLDFTAQYGVAGISGKPSTVCTQIPPLPCLPVGAGVGDTIFAGQTRGTDAFNRFFSRNPSENWLFEFKLQIPLGNQTAKAQLSTANLRLVETQTRMRALRDQVSVEVRDAVRDITTADKRIDAARETVKFADEQLDATRRKFEAGLASPYEVLQVLEDVDKARASETRALMDYNVGQSKLRLSEGSVLQKYGIELQKPPRYIFQ